MRVCEAPLLYTYITYTICTYIFLHSVPTCLTKSFCLCKTGAGFHWHVTNFGSQYRTQPMVSVGDYCSPVKSSGVELVASWILPLEQERNWVNLGDLESYERFIYGRSTNNPQWTRSGVEAAPIVFEVMERINIHILTYLKTCMYI